MLPQDIDKLKAAFGDREFTGRDVAQVLGVNAKQQSGAIVNQLKGRRIAYKTANGWRFGTPAIATPAAIAPVVPNAPICNPPVLVRIGDFLFHERTILIADTMKQNGKDAVRLATSILEYDTAFRAVRNKVIIFTKADDPREYATMKAWLDSLAGNPPQAVDDTALELAAELERQLIAAKKEIAELKAKLDIIRGAV